MTHYIQVKLGDGTTGPDVDAFTPWLNCGQDLLETTQLAAHKFIRESGIAACQEPTTFTVFSYPETEERHPSGRPKKVTATTFQVSKK